MAISDGPQARKQYGDELRRLREAAGLTQEELSVRAVMSRTHIAHIEAGRRRPDLADARRLDEALRGDGVLVRFLPTLGEGRVAEHFAEALRLEGMATVIREYAAKLVPGVLQTEAYARAVLGSGFPAKSDEERDRLLVTRLERSRILADFHTPVFWTLLDEAVLRRPAGSRAIMCEQLRHIVKLGASHRIRVHVLPYSVGLHALMEGFVSLMWFDDLPPVAYVEGLKTGRVLEVPSVVRECQAVYDHALGDALSHDASLDMIESVAKEYEHAPEQ
ncbi:helix-turn-helix domain-containing protein [Streptomyces sp. TRM66268-LWL]|uniref:Helix-turn-helix domain-containing protein n=1 Tax=Streptomyces polyasparticus TaxID=2767826 RepID=A0ABR7SU32_9ACTN|nr:helix-turn-helix transcriptional regulator [Streptomyces polyasparticus]MBC9718107.1 helix-turn-helix domain-containing protein [Streptomyces polyasparticus]